MKTRFESKLLRHTGAGKIDELRARLANMRGHYVKVGVPRGKTEKDGTPVAMIAAVHEFGSEARGIPERSFLRAGINDAKPDLVRLNRINLSSIVADKMAPADALGQLGAMAAGKVQQKITSGPFAELSERTISRKGSSKPLIDTGMLRQSITWELAK